MSEVEQGKMKAVRWEGKPFSVSVKDVDIPSVKQPMDALIRLTSAAICGTDLHVYHGRWSMNHQTFGHENLGIVQSIGSSVTTVKPGDRVVVTAINLEIAENGGMALVGSFGTPSVVAGSPSLNGGQAEHMVVPNADENLLVLPNGNDHELDYLLLSDIWPTAWFALESAGQVAGETVAVFGAGKHFYLLVLFLISDYFVHMELN